MRLQISSTAACTVPWTVTARTLPVFEKNKKAEVCEGAWFYYSTFCTLCVQKRVKHSLYVRSDKS